MKKIIMADSIMTTMKKATKSRKQCFHCDALCGDSYRVQFTLPQELCMGRVPTATEKNIIRFCSNSCMKQYLLSNDLRSLRLLLKSETETAKRTAEMVRGLKQMKERDLEYEEQVIVIWKSSQFSIKLYQACLDREPVQRLILLQAKALKYLGEVLEHFHEDPRMLETVLKKIKIVQELYLDLLGS